MPDRLKLGSSVEGRPIEAHVFNSGRGPTLIMAGIHGDEPKSVCVARRLVEELTENPPSTPIVVLPVVNPDGYSVRRRRNASGVDINRNFPTADWQPGNPRLRTYPGVGPASEPESLAVIRLIESVTPCRIIAIHSIGDHRYCNNYDGPARRLAKMMSRRNGYPVLPSMGYATPGSLGTWVGKERRIPIVTLELPSHHSPKRCWADNHQALIACCK